jgi:hypothetical protein
LVHASGNRAAAVGLKCAHGCTVNQPGCATEGALPTHAPAAEQLKAVAS